MDMTLTSQLIRTEKGQAEIFNNGHTLRPKHRQLLFTIGNGISFGELCAKHPTCTEIRNMVQDLLQNGFIQTGTSAPVDLRATVVSAPTPVPTAQPNSQLFETTRDYVLQTMANLIGTKSPAYRHMSETQGISELMAQLPACKKVIAAVASPHQAAELEAEVVRRLAR